MRKVAFHVAERTSILIALGEGSVEADEVANRDATREVDHDPALEASVARVSCGARLRPHGDRSPSTTKLPHGDDPFRGPELCQHPAGHHQPHHCEGDI